MKGFFVGLIILGGVALVGGAAVLAYGMSKSNINDNFETNEYVLEDDADNIDIDISTADIHFQKASDDKIKVVCTEKEKVYHEVKVTNKVLSIKEIDERHWYQKYLFNWDFRSMKVDVYLPETQYNDITIDTDTGDVEIEKDFTFVNMDIETHTGDTHVKCKATGNVSAKTDTGFIGFEDLTAKNLKMKTSTGNSSVANGVIEETIEHNSSTGSGKFSNVRAVSLKSKTSTGEVILNDTVLTNDLDIKTSTGDVYFNNSDAKKIVIKTSTGNVRGTLLTAKMFDAHSDTGETKLPKMSEWSETGGTCEITTSTGSINIEIA